MLCQGDYPTQASGDYTGPWYNTYVRWSRDERGWNEWVQREDRDGMQHSGYREFGLSDKEYFKRKLNGSAK